MNHASVYSDGYTEWIFTSTMGIDLNIEFMNTIVIQSDESFNANGCKCTFQNMRSH